MRKFTHLRLAAAVLAVTSIAGIGSIVWAVVGAEGVISGCLSRSGYIRGVDDATGSCRTGDTALSWYTKEGADATFAPKSTAAPSVAVRATHSVTQQFVTATVAILSFDSEVFDTANVHGADVDNSRLTAPVDGVYQITVNVLWNQQGLTGLQLIQNGTTVVVDTVRMTQVPGVVGYLNFQHLSTLTKLSAGDFVEVGAYKLGGSGIASILSGGHMLTPEFSMALVAGT